MSQHGGCQPGPEGKKGLGVYHGAGCGGGPALLSAHGYNVERTLTVLDTWAAEYADDSAAGR